MPYTVRGDWATPLFNLYGPVMHEKDYKRVSIRYSVLGMGSDVHKRINLQITKEYLNDCRPESEDDTRYTALERMVDDALKRVRKEILEDLYK